MEGSPLKDPVPSADDDDDDEDWPTFIAASQYDPAPVSSL